MADLIFADAPALLTMFRSGRETPSRVLASQLACSRIWEPKLRSYLLLDERAARSAAGAADRAWQNGDERPLLGLTLGLKDLYNAAGLPTTGASRAYGDRPAATDAFVVARLRAAGAVITGKLNMDELAFGVTSSPTRNPYRLDHIPGGSSGGSAAALAAGLVTLSIGSDTAGSIRIPAALSGVVGHKPSRGRVSRTGILPASRTLDHAGPMARDVPSLRLLFRVMDAPDPDDPLSLPALPDAPQGATGIGVPWAWFEDEVDETSLTLFCAALTEFNGMGFHEVPLAWPSPEHFAQILSLLRAPEIYMAHRDVLTSRASRLGPGLWERIAAGKDALGSDYVAAHDEAYRLTRTLEQDLESRGIGIVALPTTPCPAPAIDEQEVSLRDGRALSVSDALTRYTAPFNVTGWPAVSIPLGIGADGLPRGLQLVARRYDDEWLLNVADELSKRLPALPHPLEPRQ